MAKGTNEVLTTKEACEYLRISRPTYLKLIYTNQIKARKLGKGWKVFKSELQAYLGQVDVCELGGSERKEKRKETALREREVVDATDRNILRILSRYDHLTPLQTWYELGEADVIKTGVTEEELKDRLESLVARGLVERIGDMSSGGDSPSQIYRLKTSHAVSKSGEETVKEVGL